MKKQPDPRGETPWQEEWFWRLLLLPVLVGVLLWIYGLFNKSGPYGWQVAVAAGSMLVAVIGCQALMWQLRKTR